MRHFSRHANALPQRGMWVNRLAGMHRICPHFDGKSDLADCPACVDAHHAVIQIKHAIGHSIEFQRSGVLPSVGLALLEANALTHGLASCGDTDDGLTSAALHPTKPARPLLVRHRVGA